MKRTVTCIAVFVLLAIANFEVPNASAGSQPRPVQMNWSGTGATTFFSFDGNGPAILTTGAGNGNLGQFTIQEMFESAAEGPSCTVPGGTPNAGTGFNNLVGDVTTIRISDTGDLLYAQGLSATECADFSSGTPPFPYTGTVSGIYNGGTGKFAGASGNFKATFSGVILSAPPSPGLGFMGTVVERVEGTLTLP